MDTHYDILDFKAIVKHSYYGCDDPQAKMCEEDGRRYAGWKAAAASVIDRYIAPIIAEGSPRHLIVAHDMGTVYRSAMFPPYKAKRKEKVASPLVTENMEPLYNWVKQFLAALGATQIGVDGVEADDVIAWLCGGIVGTKTVYTVDGDLVQLANDRTIVKLKEEAYFGEGEYHNVPFHLTSIAKSITGDSSDEYPGIKGMGPKKIEDLLNTFGADGMLQLQEIVDSGNPDLLDEAIEQTQDKNLIKLKENFSEWRTMWRLANLHPELCWKPRAKKLVKPLIHKRIPNPARLYSLLEEVGCEDLWEEVFEAVMPSHTAITADNWEAARETIFGYMDESDVITFDYETSDKSPHTSFHQASASGTNFVDVLSHELAGASFTFGKHYQHTIYVTVDHKDSPNLPKSVIAEILEYAGSKARLVAHNAYFEGVVSQTNLNLTLKSVHDTRVMQRYYDENDEAGLKSLSKRYLGYDQASYQDTLAAGNGGEGVSMMCELTLDEVFSYGADDAQVTALIYDLLKLMLQVDNQWQFYQEWAVEPTVILQHAYIHGVNINWQLQKEIHERDIKQVAEGLVELRDILDTNVTGEVTPGCESFVEAEKDYIFRAAKAKGDSESASRTLYEWKTRLERACAYLPYREEEVMPQFALTPKQLTDAAEAVGLPPVTKVSLSGIAEYLTEQGVMGLEPSIPDDENQAVFLQTLIDGLKGNAFKLKSLETSAAKAEADGKPERHTQLLKQAEVAGEALEHMGVVLQGLAKVEPKLIKAGDELNVGSPQQMQQLLYCKIGVPVRLFGKTVGLGRKKLGIRNAGPSTDETAIETAIANDIEPGSWQESALRVLLKVKSASTRISLYHSKYPLWAHRDGKIHPGIMDAGTDTRRPTGSAPNILQVSKKDKSMRSLFMPPTPEHVVVAIDYSGQEIRLMACEANDPVMISVYDPANEKDLHSMTGAGIAKMDYDLFVSAKDDENHELNGITNAIRGKAKGVNFGLAYGAGPATLSRNLIVPIKEAEELLHGTMTLYARIPKWQAETAKFMERNGFTLTAFGTKRHANDDIFSSDRGKVGRQHRQGVNATIQGTAAEMLRIVLTKMVQRDLLNRLNMVFFAPVYDEVVAFVHKDDVVEYCREMQDIMSSATPPGHVIPQVPEFSIGCDWGRLHELGRWPGEEAIEKATAVAISEATDVWEHAQGLAA